MNYKLLVLDLDGTLLTKTKHISSKDLKALKAYTSLGGKIALATGRAIASTTYYKNIIEQYTGEKIPFIISLCGSDIKSFDNANDDKFTTLPDEIVKALDSKAKELRLSTWIYSKDEIADNTVLCNYKLFAPIAKIFKKLRVKKFDHNRNLEAFKINIFANSKYNISQFAKFLAEEYSDKLSFTFTGERHLEICAKDIDKGFGIKYIAKKLNIPLNQVAAFGDTGNDLPAFKAVKFSAAINSKSDTLRSNSSVEIDQFRSGVSTAINNYIINNKFNPVKLIATDLDGTLLSKEDKQPVPEAISAIQQITDNNVSFFCIATGRNVADANRFLQKLNLSDNVEKYIIADNGAILYSMAQRQCIRFRGMPYNIANQILDIIKECNKNKTFKEIGTFIHIYDEDDTNSSIDSGYKKLIKKYGYNKDFVIKQITARAPKFFGPNNPSSNIIEIDHIEPNMKPTKFVMNFVDSKERAKFFDYIKTFGYPLEYSMSGDVNLEINTLNVNKGKAIKTLIGELGIDPMEVLAVGDETNDITMLKMTEWSFCTADCRDVVLDNTRYAIESKPSYIVKEAIDLYLKEYKKYNDH